MPGARGDALDWALALAAAPAERMVLRQRPLPDGIEPLLQVAAGIAGPALTDAVARSGESPESVQELVRFYLREVLFHSGADAYRVLGLRRDAGPEQVKAHHRWLQQWLHPDRHSSDWDAIFAGRVNAAWNNLRNDERRRAYDAEHPEPPARGAPEMALSGGAGWVQRRLEPDTAQDRWRRRAPLLALVAACGVLGILAIRDVSRDEAMQGAAADMDAPGPLPEAEAEAGAATTILGDLHFPRALGARVPAEPKAAAAPRARATPPGDARRAPPDAIEVDDPPSTTIARTARVPPEPPATEGDSLRARPQAPRTAAADLPARARAAEPEPTPGVPTARPAGAVAPAAMAAKPSPGTVPPSPAVSAERVKLAQSTGASLLAFLLRRSDSIPPIWDALSTQRDAVTLRNGLPDSDRRAAPTPPSWRVGERNASMAAELHYPDGRRARIAASLVWREERWLVNSLRLEGGE